MADQIRKIISNIFIKYYTKITNSIITITKVKMSSDLKLAKIYVSIFNNDNNNCFEEEFNNIKSNKSNIRYYLGINLNSKYVPEIKFFKDDQYDLFDKINKISKNG